LGGALHIAMTYNINLKPKMFVDLAASVTLEKRGVNSAVANVVWETDSNGQLLNVQVLVDPSVYRTDCPSTDLQVDDHGCIHVLCSDSAYSGMIRRLDALKMARTIIDLCEGKAHDEKSG
jgi:hypothetical protein